VNDTEIISALRRMLDASDTWKVLAEELRMRHGWEGSAETALTSLSQMLRGDGRRHFPASDLDLAVRVTGLDYVTPLLQLTHLEARMKVDERKGARSRESPPQTVPGLSRDRRSQR